MLYFIHGLNGFPGEWEYFIDVFSKNGYKCSAVDFKKDLDLRKTCFQDYVNLILEMIDEDDILIGQSMGGLIVQKVAEVKNFKAGVCICSATPKGILMNRTPFLSQIRYIPYIISNTPFKPSFHLAYQLLLSKMPEKKARILYDKLEVQSARVSFEVLRNKIEVDEAKVHTPFLFIGRKQDAIVPIDSVKEVAEKYDAPMILFDGNHYIYDDAEIMFDAIHDFIKDK